MEPSTGWSTVKSRHRFLARPDGTPLKVLWPRSAIGGDDTGNFYYKEGVKSGHLCVFPDGGRVEIPAKDFLAWRGDPKLYVKDAEEPEESEE